MNAEIMISPFSNLPQNGRNIICVSSSPWSEKVKKNIVREVCTKGISFVEHGGMDEKITNENTSQKFNVKTAGSSTTTLNKFQMKNF